MFHQWNKLPCCELKERNWRDCGCARSAWRGVPSINPHLSSQLSDRTPRTIFLELPLRTHHRVGLLNARKVVETAPRMTAWLLPTLTLTSLAVGSSLWPTTVRPISVWDGAPVVYARRRPSPALVLLERHLAFPVYSQRRRRVGEPPPCSSSAAASSDAAREEESWPAELSVDPLFRSYPSRQQTATSGDREALMFPRPLPEGTILRGMQNEDVDGVVDL